MEKKNIVQDHVPKGIKIRSIKRLPNKEDVYCLATNNGNFIANGIIVKNCDALRYAIATHKVPKMYADKENFGRTLGFNQRSSIF